MMLSCRSQRVYALGSRRGCSSRGAVSASSALPCADPGQGLADVEDVEALRSNAGLSAGFAVAPRLVNVSFCLSWITSLCCCRMLDHLRPRHRAETAASFDTCAACTGFAVTVAATGVCHVMSKQYNRLVHISGQENAKDILGKLALEPLQPWHNDKIATTYAQQLAIQLHYVITKMTSYSSNKRQPHCSMVLQILTAALGKAL